MRWTRRDFLARSAAGAAAGLLAAAVPAQARVDDGVNRVLVLKGRRLLRLMRDHVIVREYRAALGFNPIGHKQRRGDGRTPEGLYHIAWRNPTSAFHLSLNISYPSRADVERALARGVDPGDLIMIHGQPNPIPGEPYRPRKGDWTEGCVAVQNPEMEEIWHLVADFTPVEIRA